MILQQLNIKSYRCYSRYQSSLSRIRLRIFHLCNIEQLRW